MTSSSQEVKPLPCPACGSSTAQRAVAVPLWQIVCDLRDGGCGLSSRYADTREEAVLYWNRRRELESRVYPGVATDEIAALKRRAEAAEEDWQIAETEVASLKQQVIDSALRAERLEAENGTLAKRLQGSHEERAHIEAERTTLGVRCMDLRAENAQLVERLNDFTNRHDENMKRIEGFIRDLAQLRADRTALIEGKVWRDIEVRGWWAMSAAWSTPMRFSSGDEALAAYRASLSPQSAPPTLEFQQDEFSKGISLGAQPAEPTGAKNEDAIRGKAFIAGWLSGETHGSTHGVALGYEELRAKAEATANRYVDAHKSANLNKPITPLASHPAEPETPSHLCPRCGAACVCAEGFDGDPCQHYRIGCKSAAPAEPEGETTR